MTVSGIHGLPFLSTFPARSLQKIVRYWSVDPWIVCFGTHQIKFKKTPNDSSSKTDFTKAFKINEIESDDEKDSDEDEDGESGSGSDSGGMAAKQAVPGGYCQTGTRPVLQFNFLPTVHLKIVLQPNDLMMKINVTMISRVLNFMMVK